MRKIQGISFPRTGHSLLMNYLMRYFSRDLNWIENVQEHLRDGLMYADPFVYCESYHHCHQTPCPHPDTTFQKDHDFNFRIEHRDEQYYLVQNRDPLPAIISLYKLTMKDSPRRHRLSLRSLISGRDSARHQWKDFLLHQLDNWQEFQNKWVLPNHPNCYVLDYDDMANRPMEKIREVIQFLDPNHAFDEAWYVRAVESVNVHAKDTVTTFKYYDTWTQKVANEYMDRVSRSHAA